MPHAEMKSPGPDHPIAIAPAAGRVTVTAHGRILADTSRALVLREASYPPVFYIPRDDVSMSALQRTAHSTHCPYKGDACYFAIAARAGGHDSEPVNVAWSYEAPYPAMADIAHHIAFYRERIDAIALESGE